MAANILAFFDWRCAPPLDKTILRTLENTLLRSAPLLEPMGLLGQVGTCDVWTVDEQNGLCPANGVMIRRLDIPEMRLYLGPGSSAMDLSLLWGFYAATNRKAEVSRLALEMAGQLPITELFLAPHGLDAFANQAFEKVCQACDFEEVRTPLLASKYSWGFKKDPSNIWTTMNRCRSMF